MPEFDADGICLRIKGIVEESIVDGPGLRLAVFTQGCPHHCPGCHNPETHDPSGGYLSRLADIMQMYSANPLLSGITFSGGEPFLQALSLSFLADMVHAKGGDVVTYTGYLYEELAHGANAPENATRLLEATDLLVDGPYRQELRSLELLFRGSSNQRLLTRQDRKDLDRQRAF